MYGGDLHGQLVLARRGLSKYYCVYMGKARTAVVLDGTSSPVGGVGYHVDLKDSPHFLDDMGMPHHSRSTQESCRKWFNKDLGREATRQ